MPVNILKYEVYNSLNTQMKVGFTENVLQLKQV